MSELVIEETASFIIPATVDMNHDWDRSCSFRRCANPAYASCNELTQLLPLLRRIMLAIDSSLPPDHAVRNFIADLHHIRQRALLFQIGNKGSRKFLYSGNKFFKA
ncbi:hypothetical protein D3C77_576960 [compost metagenome]